MKINMATNNTTSIETSLYDDLSNFLGEAKAIADLLISATHQQETGFDLDDSTILHVAQAQYEKASDLKTRFDKGGAS